MEILNPSAFLWELLRVWPWDIRHLGSPGFGRLGQGSQLVGPAHVHTYHTLKPTSEGLVFKCGQILLRWILQACLKVLLLSLYLFGRHIFSL